jgi:KaiC/GvpD/RAD55 family RecA-like ATPase
MKTITLTEEQVEKLLEDATQIGIAARYENDEGEWIVDNIYIEKRIEEALTDLFKDV